MNKKKYIGYIRYEGDLAKEGLMDAQKQARALLAIDHAFRYFIAKQVYDKIYNKIYDEVHKKVRKKVREKVRKEIRRKVYSLGFEIPVKIKGTPLAWELLIPDIIATGLNAMVIEYLVGAGYKTAGKDFADIGVTELCRKSANMIKWVAKIAMRVRTTSWKSLQTSKHPNDKSLVRIYKVKGKYIDVPKDVFRCIRYGDSKLLKKLAENIECDRNLVIGTLLKGKGDEVVIYLKDKNIFVKDKPKIKIFPDLKHGKRFVLEGHVTRQNETTNSMGFRYKKIILTVYPANNNIVPCKPVLFLTCILEGEVCRKDGKGGNRALRPTLYFDKYSTG